jgi:hypothetical protein
MIETVWRNRNRGKGLRVRLAAVIVVGGVGCGSGWAAETSPADRAGPPISQAGVWGEMPIQPWDETLVDAAGWSQRLNRKIDLTRKGRAREQRRYVIRRQNLTLDRQGKVINRTISEGTVRRALLREVEPGLWSDRTEWERFAYVQSSGPTDAPKPQEQEKARGIAYEFSPRTFDALNPPGDFARLADPLVSYAMKVVAMDIAGFDAFVLGMRDRFGKGLQIGSTIRSRGWERGQKIGQPSGKEVTGGYQLGETTTMVAGITRRGGEPCVLLWFSAEGNAVQQEMDNPQFTFRMQGTEYFRGTLAVSLVDGHIVAGELWGPLPMRLELGIGGQPPREQPIAAVLQQVSLWEVRATGEKPKGRQ